jgi:hypothetical protein
MNQDQVIIVAVVAVLAVVGVIGFLLTRKKRTQLLRERFGPEYDRVVKKEGDVHEPKAFSRFETNGVKSSKSNPFLHLLGQIFAMRWTSVQSQFVDDPKGAVSKADHLVSELMQARGYPVGEFDQRAADISVDHPVVVDNYRAAHEIAIRHDRRQASTEDLRKAMVHYRSLFDELLETSIPERKEARG